MNKKDYKNGAASRQAVFDEIERAWLSGQIPTTRSVASAIGMKSNSNVSRLIGQMVADGRLVFIGDNIAIPAWLKRAIMKLPRPGSRI